MKSFGTWIQALAFCCAASESWGQSVSESGSVIAPNRLRITPALSFSDIDYDVARSTDDFSIENELLGIEFGHGLMPKIDLTGHLLYLVDATLDDCSGEGFGWGFGSHFEAQRAKRSRIILNAQVNRWQQDFNCPDGAELQQSVTEFSVGASYNQRLHALWDVFGGLRLTPFSKGLGKNEKNDASYDFKRDSLFSLTLGGSTRLLGNRLRVELWLFGETSIILGYGVSL